MYLIQSQKSETRDRYHVFVDVCPQVTELPKNCRVVENVTLIAHPPCDDPDAPTLRVVLYRDPLSPNEYHYLLSPQKALHLKRVGGSPYVFHTWDEFAEMHPGLVAEMTR